MDILPDDPDVGGIIPIEHLSIDNRAGSYPKVCCPEIVFFYIPTRDTRLYNLIKLISNLDDGVQSQILVHESFKKQGERTGI